MYTKGEIKMKKDKIEYAIYYATKAHKNQRRKIEKISEERGIRNDL